MQVSQFKVVEIAKMSTQGGDTTKYRSRQDMIIQGGDTTKYRSRQYHTTRRRYNKVPEPPIQHYEAEIQQSTGAANTTLRGGDTTKYRSRQYNIRGGDTTKYRSRQYHDTRRRYNNPAITVTLHCYNTQRPRYTKSTNSRYSYNYSVLLQ